MNYIGGLVQDCSISISNALEILLFCAKPSIWIVIFTAEKMPVILFYLYRFRDKSKVNNIPVVSPLLCSLYRYNFTVMALVITIISVNIDSVSIYLRRPYTIIGSGAHFTNELCLHNRNIFKNQFGYHFECIDPMRSQFSHTTESRLSWHVQNCHVIGSHLSLSNKM